MEKANLEMVRKFELETWTRCSSSYARTWATLTNETLTSLIQKTDVKSGDNVLDIGCGSGNSTYKIKETGANVIGIDFSKQMIDKASSNYPDITFKHSDAENIPLKDNSMDVVIANYVVHHFADPKKVFTEIHRILKPNGKFAFAVWGLNEEQSSIGAFFQAFANHHELSELPHGPLFGITNFDIYNKLITSANLKNLKLSNHKNNWNMSSLDPLIEGCWDWGNLHVFPESKQNDIKKDFVKNCDPFKNENGYSFPHSALIGFAKK